MQRYDSIEGWRALLAWWVVAGHLLGASGYQVPYFQEMNTVFGDAMFVVRNGAIAVWVFMIISGFVITHLLLVRDEPYYRYIARRFCRLWPLHVAMLILSFTLWKLGYIGMNLGQAGEALSFVAEASMLQGILPNELWMRQSSIINAPDWSISLEWQFYLVAPLIVTAFVRPSASRYIVFASILGLLAVGWLGVRNPVIFGNQWTYTFPSALPCSIMYFFIGVVSRLLLERAPAVATQGLVVTMTAAMVAYILTPSFGDKVVFVVWTLIFLSLSSPTNALNRLFRHPAVMYLGKISFSTYLCHHLLVHAVERNLVRHFAEPASIEKLLWMSAICVPLTLLVSILAFSFIERPGIELCRRVLNVGKSPGANSGGIEGSVA